MNLAVVEIKAFVPATDFERSQRFYAALGFEIPSVYAGIAYVRYGATSFLLEETDDARLAESFQMHLLVESANDWHAHVVAAGVVAQFGVSLGEPGDRPWGMRDFTLSDPSGVLWRIAQNIR